MESGEYKLKEQEVQIAILEHKAVREAFVWLREDRSGGKRLIAYIVPNKQEMITIAELRQFLAGSLPNQKVPVSFVMLDALPRNPDGNISYRDLPPPGPPKFNLERPFTLPCSPVEKKILEVWKEVLGLDEINIYDSFMKLGGRTPLDGKIAARVLHEFGIDSFEEHPDESLLPITTIADMAEKVVRRLTESLKSEEMDTIITYLESLSDKEAGHLLANDGALGNLDVYAGRPGATLREQEKPGIDGNIIQRRKTFSPCPLSSTQLRLWFLYQLDPDNPMYNNSRTMRLSGFLNVEALHHSLKTIVERHESLRTNFANVDGVPRQLVASNWTLDLLVVDLSRMSGTDLDIKIERLIEEEVNRPFDLGRDLMLRTTLLKMSENEHLLILTMHHIATDGWSFGILHRELESLYNAFLAGEPPSLPELPLQYCDFAAWQQDQMQGDRLAKLTEYWTGKLSGAPFTLELPADRPRSLSTKQRSVQQTLMLPSSLTKGLYSLNRRHGVTMFMTLLAAFKTLLYHYTNQVDILVGTAVANRTQPQTEGLIGFFTNTLVLRTDLSGKPAFCELLVRVRQVCLEAYEYQDMPFERLVQELAPERDLSQNPLIQVMFVMQNMQLDEPELTGVAVTSRELYASTSRFDLTLEIQEKAQGIMVSAVYNADLFEKATISRLLGHFQTLLEGATADPQARLSDLPILAEDERNQILVEWNDTYRDFPRDLSIQNLFEAQVERTPEAVAVVFEDQELTFRQLNAQANQLAHYLQFLGIGTESLVGICMKRSLEMEVALLGILKAGGAYVPMDSTHPRKRLAFTLQDSAVEVLLTQKKILDSLPEYKTHFICLDTDWEIISSFSKENPENGLRPENLAYVIYTSGSTGMPKGVMIEHRSLVNHLCWAGDEFLGDEVDVLPANIPLTFDPSVKQLLGVLLKGKTVRILPEDISANPVAFLKEISKYRNVAINCVASMWKSILDVIKSGEVEAPVESLVCVHTGAENFSRKLVDDTLEIFPDLHFWNSYGPTEATVAATAAELSSKKRVVIGRPIANTQVYILDENLQPVPVGIAGELYIGGVGLARGYLNQPELTRKLFIPDPFSKEAGARIYKTGDMARYLPDGDIEFLGRQDQQVKVRGNRIELGEIEAALDQYPDIQSNAAAIQEDTSGNKQLVAYIVPRKGRSPSAGEFRRFLRDKLPVYMVPSVFVTLDDLPMNPHGKVDRLSLAEIEWRESHAEDVYVSPGTAMERQIAEIWAQVLGLKRVGIHNNFFDLGGHSLLAARAISRMRKALYPELPLRAMFDAPTVAEMTELVGMLLQSGEEL